MMQNLTQKQMFILFAGGVVLLVLIYFIFASSSEKSGSNKEPLKLQVWGYEDPSSVMQSVIDAYRPFASHVEIAYRYIPFEEYDETLLNALALGEGPDVFAINNRSLPRHKAKIAPLIHPDYNLAQLREMFPTVVEQDFVSDGQIYALPLYLDTLTLFYNKDMLDRAGITAPPKTWVEFQQQVPLLRRLSSSGQLEQAAAGIGGSEKSVKYATDILNLLMMQNGSPMTDRSNTRTDFFSDSATTRQAGLQAFNFYLQFANSASPYFTWNDTQALSFDEFASEKSAFLFAYPRDLHALKKKNPYMRFGIAPMPQVDLNAAINYPSYLGFAVSKQSLYPNDAWSFVHFATTNELAQLPYLNTGSHAPALRSLVGPNQTHPDLGVFVRQVLTARSWYQPDDAEVKEAFSLGIEGVLKGQFDSSRALRQVADKIDQLMLKVKK